MTIWHFLILYVTFGAGRASGYMLGIGQGWSLRAALTFLGASLTWPLEGHLAWFGEVAAADWQEARDVAWSLIVDVALNELPLSEGLFGINELDLLVWTEESPRPIRRSAGAAGATVISGSRS